MLTVQSLNKFSVTFVLLAVFASVLCEAARTLVGSRPPRCYPGLYVECNLGNEDIVWATDPKNQTCIPFVNTCVFNMANCNFFKQGIHQLNRISWEDCRKICDRKECPQTSSVEEQVCAKREEKFCLFESTCRLEKHICTSGELWTNGIHLSQCRNGLEADSCYSSLNNSEERSVIVARV